MPILPKHIYILYIQTTLVKHPFHSALSKKLPRAAPKAFGFDTYIMRMALSKYIARFKMYGQPRVNSTSILIIWLAFYSRYIWHQHARNNTKVLYLNKKKREKNNSVVMRAQVSSIKESMLLTNQEKEKKKSFFKLNASNRLIILTSFLLDDQRYFARYNL